MTRLALACALVLTVSCSDDPGPEHSIDATTNAAPDADVASLHSGEPDADSGATGDESGDDADVATDAPEPPGPLEWALDEPGPFNVGYRSYDVTYQRPDIDENRTIPVSVWYPTTDESGTPPRYLGLFVDNESMTDAVPAAPVYDFGYPVHVHSHGFQGWSATSAFMMRHYASHGWIAVAPDHIGNTFIDHRDPLDNAHYFLKPLDIQESLDLLGGLPEDDPLVGLAHLDEVLMSGHSFGTYACWAVGGATYDEVVVRAECEDLSSGPCSDAELNVLLSGDLADERVVAMIPLAGTYRTAWFGDAGHESVDIPILAMTGSEDNPDSSQAQWDRLGSVTDMTWVDLDGGCHQTFALGGCDNLNNDEGYRIVNTFALAFGRFHVLGDDSEGTVAVLTGDERVSPAATLLRNE